MKVKSLGLLMLIFFSAPFLISAGVGQSYLSYSNEEKEEEFPVTIGWFWGPDNFEECCSDNIKGISSRIAVQAVILACAKLYPKNKNSQPLSSSDKKFYKCLLKEMKGVSNDVAAKLTIFNCWQKYQKR